MLPTLERNTFRSIANKNVLKKAGSILLTNVPRTATPRDILREINKAGAKGVVNVAIDYEYFKPAERAILTLSSPDYLRDNLKAFQNLTISAISVRASPYDSKTPFYQQSRMRGQRGRSGAADRGTLSGYGPRAGITNNEKTVVLGGLPARTSEERLTEMFRNFKIAHSEKGIPQIEKLPLPLNTFSLTAKFLVTLTSVTEAHRFVRKLHASYLPLYGEDIPITAKIIV